MKAITIFKKGSRMAWSPYSLPVKCLILGALMLTGVQATLLQAQEPQFTEPSWWFGGAGGANINFYRGSTHELNSEFTPPVTFHDGLGVGLYFAPLVEYHRPDGILGFMLQAGYDSRKGTFDRVFTDCNCPAYLSADLKYMTIEPSLRIAPFRSNFYLYAGPRIAFNMAQFYDSPRVAFNMAKSFTYEQGTNPDYPDQSTVADVNGDFSHINNTLLSMQVGVGHDIRLSSQNKQTQVMLSPFVAFHPYFGQHPRSIETWNITTLRTGLTLKIGRGREIAAKEQAKKQVYKSYAVTEPDVTFAVNAPENVPVERRVRETFPVRNYVFFNEGSTEIPNRYVLLRKDQVKDFSNDQLEVFTPKDLSGRSKRQMTVYYNVVNILGDRMVRYPNTNVTLTGSSREGVQDGKAMAESTKEYLTDVFEIAPARIQTEGRLKPVTPSEQPGGIRELALLREEDRRVSITSDSPALLMEFQSGPDAPLKPVEIVGLQVAPLDSYVSFTVEGAKKAFSSWSLEIRDEKGTLQNFGPFTKERVSIPGKSILGKRPKGDYKVTMVGKTKSGKTVRKETTTHMVLWTPPENEQGMRYSLIFEFGESKPIAVYDKYLTDIVSPKIPRKGTVIIHGYTDIIGDEEYNLKLSQARANETKRIIESALSKAGRSDVKFKVYGFGEDQNLAKFANDTPEERFYNRTVIIDIIPPK